VFIKKAARRRGYQEGVMVRVWWYVSFVVMVVIGCVGHAVAGGDIFVVAEPGIAIWLDEEFKGKVEEGQPGVVLEDVYEGEHTLTATKLGFVPVTLTVAVKENKAVQVDVSLSTPAMISENITETKEVKLIKESATLVARSIPIGAFVFFNGKKMGTTDLKFTHVAPDTYTVRFEFAGKSLEESVELHVNEERLIKADFLNMKVFSQEMHVSKEGFGDAVMLLQTARARKPALFPHRKHQDMFECGECHHGKNQKGEQTPYVEGMKIRKCVTCHNSSLPNKRLNHFKFAAHAKCKGCHQAKAADHEKAGPIIKCGGCHPKKKKAVQVEMP
jgi:hypothetical protein